MENNLIPSPEELNTYQVMAKQAANAKFFEKIGSEGGLLSMMLYARELGLPPLQCLFGGMNNIQGKIELSPRLMNSMIRKAGHKLEILESTNAICRIKGTRTDTGESYTATYDIGEAKVAGIYREGSPWTKHPSDMVFKSCLSRLARRLFPDIISTAYVEDEIENNEKESKIIEATIIEEPVIKTIPVIHAEEIKRLLNGDKELAYDFFQQYKIEKITELKKEEYTGAITWINTEKELRKHGISKAQ